MLCGFACTYVSLVMRLGYKPDRHMSGHSSCLTIPTISKLNPHNWWFLRFIDYPRIIYIYTHIYIYIYKPDPNYGGGCRSQAVGAPHILGLSWGHPNVHCCPFFGCVWKLGAPWYTHEILSQSPLFLMQCWRCPVQQHPKKIEVHRIQFSNSDTYIYIHIHIYICIQYTYMYIYIEWYHPAIKRGDWTYPVHGALLLEKNHREFSSHVWSNPKILSEKWNPP